MRERNSAAPGDPRAIPAARLAWRVDVTSTRSPIREFVAIDAHTGVLAAVFNQIADKAKVWTFKIRNGVKFHDGTPFTADDVIFTVERARDPGSDMKSYVGIVKEIKKIDDWLKDNDDKPGSSGSIHTPRVPVATSSPWRYASPERSCPCFPVYETTTPTLPTGITVLAISSTVANSRLM